MVNSNNLTSRPKTAWEILLCRSQPNNVTSSWKLDSRQGRTAIFSVILIAIPFLALILVSQDCLPIFYGSGFSKKLRGLLKSGSFQAEKNRSQKPLSPLEEILDKASMPNKTVIITTLNAAWAENGSMFDFFLESFHSGAGTENMLRHLIVVNLDQKAYDRCVNIHPLCYKLIPQGVNFSEEKRFMTGDYLEMMWTRILFLTVVLESGYSFLFSDTDIMWLRNPFPLLSLDYDFQISCDQFSGNSTDLKNDANTGLIFVRANNRTLTLFKYWYRSREFHPNLNDQPVLNSIKYEKGFLNIGLKIRFLDTKFFGCFCAFPTTNLDTVITMHANCCIGLKAKLQDLKCILDDWHQYRSNHTRVQWRSPYACPNSWR